MIWQIARKSVGLELCSVKTKHVSKNMFFFQFFFYDTLKQLIYLWAVRQSGSLTFGKGWHLSLWEKLLLTVSYTDCTFTYWFSVCICLPNVRSTVIKPTRKVCVYGSTFRNKLWAFHHKLFCNIKFLKKRAFVHTLLTIYRMLKTPANTNTHLNAVQTHFENKVL